MMARVLAYFRPYWRPGLVVACIAVQAVLGLAPAVVFKSLIDTLARPHPSFPQVALLVAAGIGAAAVAGLTGVGEAYQSTRISQGIVATLRRQLFGRCSTSRSGFSPTAGPGTCCRGSTPTSTGSKTWSPTPCSAWCPASW